MPSHLGSRSSPLRPERGGDRPSVTRGRRAVRVSPELRHPSPRDKSAREPEVLCVPGRPNNRMAQCPLARRPTRQTPSNTPRRLQLQGPNAARRKTPSPAAECTPYIMSRPQRLRKSSKSLSRKKKKVNGRHGNTDCILRLGCPPVAVSQLTINAPYSF